MGATCCGKSNTDEPMTKPKRFGPKKGRNMKEIKKLMVLEESVEEQVERVSFQRDSETVEMSPETMIHINFASVMSEIELNQSKKLAEE